MERLSESELLALITTMPFASPWANQVRSLIAEIIEMRARRLAAIGIPTGTSLDLDDLCFDHALPDCPECAVTP